MGISKRLIKRGLFETKSYRLNSIFDRCYILCYHMIAQQPNGFYPQTSVGEFERHIVHLTRYYKVVALEEIVARIKEGRSLRGCVAITFDDGFKDNYENAYPILRKYNLRGTIFLATGYIGNETVPWFITLRHIFMTTGRESFVNKVDGKEELIRMRTKEEKYAASEKLMGVLKRSPQNARKELLYELSREMRISETKELNNLMLNWKEINEMAKNGISFGAHTVNHPVMSNIPVEMAKQEIQESKTIIEKQLGKPVRTFAYPFGKRAEYSAEIFPILKELQFECAVSTERGTNTHNAGLFELKRGAPWELRMLNCNEGIL